MSSLWSLLVKAPLIVAATIVMGTLSVAVSFVDAGGRRQHVISRAWARMLLLLGGVRVRLHGLEKLDSSGHYVFVGNHLSLYDTPVVLASIPFQFLFLVSARYVRLPFLGTHLRRSGHFSVDSDDMRASLKVMTAAAKRIEERGLSVLIFPEGRRSPDGLMHEFKEGAAYIAIKAQAPIVPFALRGTRAILPVGSRHVRGGWVDFIVGEPIETKDMALKDRELLTALARERVTQLLEEQLAERIPA